MLNSAINRELDQKIKLISGLTNHKEITRSDLKSICKVVENMDKRWGLWEHSHAYEEIKKREEEELTKIDLTYKKSKNKANKDTDKEKNGDSGSTSKDQAENEDGKEADDDEGSSHQNGNKEIVTENGEANEKAPLDKSDDKLLSRNPLLTSARRYLEYLVELKTRENEEKAAQAQKIEPVETPAETKSVEVDDVKDAKDKEEDDSKSEDAKMDDVIECKLEDESLEKSDETSQKAPQKETKKEGDTNKPISWIFARIFIILMKIKNKQQLNHLF